MDYLIDIGRQSFELTCFYLQDAFYMTFAIIPFVFAVHVILGIIVLIYDYFHDGK